MAVVRVLAGSEIRRSWRALLGIAVVSGIALGSVMLSLAGARRADTSFERFRASGFEPEGKTLYAYAAVQVWAQAAEKASSLELPAMIASLREHQFDTVLGPIDFDEKGDLAIQNPVWWVWRGGEYMPLEHASAKE